MTRLLLDENVPPAYAKGLSRRMPDLEMVRVQDVGIAGASDPQILDFSAQRGLVVLTLDGATFPDFAYDRLRAGLSFPGVIVISQKAGIQAIVDDVELVVRALSASELANTVRRVPL
jgi:predicted nuclease of predicted toxin-antitoxin system